MSRMDDMTYNLMLELAILDASLEKLYNQGEISDDDFEIIQNLEDEREELINTIDEMRD